MAKRKAPGSPKSAAKKPRSKKPSAAPTDQTAASPPSESADRQKTEGKPSGRGQRGRFAAGNKVGKGRPKGTRNRVTLLVEQMLEGEAEALTEKLIDKGLNGSTEAMKIIFGIMAPARKDRLVEMSMPKIESLEDLVSAHGFIIRSVTKGEISPSEGHSIAALLDLRRRAVESIQIEERLLAIEARLGDQGQGGHHNGFRAH